MAIKELFYDNRPQVLLDLRASQRIDPRFKFTRNSTGTYIDDNGVLQTASANQPRFAWNPSDLAKEGLLIEPTTSNAVRNSTQLHLPSSPDDGFSTGGNVSRTANAGIAPDGSNTATLFEQIAPCSNNASRLQPVSTYYTMPANTQHVYSVFVKLHTSASENLFAFKFFTDAYSYTSSTPATYISGTLTFNSQGIATNNSAPAYVGYEAYPNGWYRIWMPFRTYTTGLTFAGVAIAVGEELSLAPTLYGKFLIWGMQIEATGGRLRPTSFIPTTTAGVTRAADLLSVEAPLPSSGSVYIDARAISATENDTLLSLKNSSNNKIDLAYLSNATTYNSLALSANYNGTSKASLPLPVPTTARERNIITWGAQNYQYGRDSSRFATSLSSSVPTGLNKLSIGHDAVDPTKTFNGYINTVYAWSGELTPAVAEALVRNDLDPINADTYSLVGPAGALALVINTQGASVDGDKTFTLPAESVATDNDIVITWGDGTESGLNGANAELGAAGLTHAYPAAGIYPVWVEGQMENIYYNNIANAADLLQIAVWGTGDMFTAPSTMANAFYGCSQMDFSSSARTTANLPDTSAVTNWYRSFRDCSSITGTFPSFTFTAATTFQESWQGCSSMTSFVAAGNQTQNVTNFSFAWDGCFSLKSFPLINTANGANFSAAWRNCSSLDNIVNGGEAASFPQIDTAAGTDFSSSWDGCSSLVIFPLIDTSKGTSFTEAWRGCSSLTTFFANFFNSWTGTPVNRCFYLTWSNCSSLTPNSVANILDSIAASTKSAPSGTDIGDKEITIDYSTSTGHPYGASLVGGVLNPAPATITTLKSRNWDVVLNGVSQ